MKDLFEKVFIKDWFCWLMFMFGYFLHGWVR